MKTGCSSQRLVRCSVLIAAILLAAQTALATNIRGRVQRMGPGGYYPAAGMSVYLAVYNHAARRYVPHSSPAITGPDGMYYLYNIAPGNYSLIVQYPNRAFMSYPLSVPNMPNLPNVFFDIAPISIQ